MRFFSRKNKTAGDSKKTAKSSVETVDLQGRSILIVDDSPTQLHILKGYLEEAGCEVLMADNGEMGIKQARANKPDLVLMDVVMPGLNGFQATRLLSRDPETNRIPIIMVTTKDQDTDKTWALRQGARDYLIKPVEKDELLAKISEAL
jgi:twitching motility two-component system response regulator PilH